MFTTPFQNFSAAVTGANNATWTFSGSVPQTLANQLTTWSSGTTNFTITNSSTSGLTVTATLTLSGALNLGAGKVLTIGGTTTPMIATTGAKNLNATSTVYFAGSGNQVVAATTYGNLVLTNAGTKSPSGTVTVAGDLTLDSGITYSGASNPSFNIAGNFVNNAVSFTPGTGTYTFNGSASQSITGATTFYRMAVNNSATGINKTLTLNNDLTIANSGASTAPRLTFTAGRILTGANRLIFASTTATVSGASSATGWVVGNFQKLFAAGTSSKTFEVGTNDASAPLLAYTPVTTSFVGIGGSGGSLIVYPTAAEHAQISTSGINDTKNVNRWWTLTTSDVSGTAIPSFTSVDLTFTFDATDVDSGATTSNFQVARWNGSSWTALTPGTRTATSTQATGVTLLGAFALGERLAPSLSTTVLTYSDPFNGTSDPKAIPGAVKEYVLTFTNPGSAVDADTVVISNPTPNNSSIFVNDIGISGSGPVLFTDGSPSSALTYTFTSLSSFTDDLEFSNDSGATWTYIPIPDVDGCDPLITNIRLRPKGSFASGLGGSPPTFQFNFRTCVQ